MLVNFLLIFLISTLQLSCWAQVSTNQLCVDKFDIDARQAIQRDDGIAYNYVVSKIDCILDADKGVSTFSVINPEEALIGAALVSGQASVIGEINNMILPYQAAVLIKWTNTSSSFNFANARNLKYCHPGYDHDELITKYVLDEFDRKVLQFNCSSSKTLIEQQFEARSQFFGSSCIPGLWTEDTELDTELKAKYPSLCSLCTSSDCSVKYHLPLSQTLLCLANNGGDIAITTVNYASNFFLSNATRKNYFKYLCSNGTVSSTPCSWTSQIKKLVISSSASAGIMKNYIQMKLPAHVFSNGSSNLPIETHLENVLDLNRFDKINLINPTPLSNYVSGHRTIPKFLENIQCNRTLKWAVSEREEPKCQWLQQASLTIGLQPLITCVRAKDNDTLSVMESLESSRANIAFVDADFVYLGKKKNLEPVAYVETDPTKLYKILLVVRNDSNINSLKDLKSKSLCLPQYRGKEWLALISTLVSAELLSRTDYLTYEDALIDFVGQSCAPGALEYTTDLTVDQQEKIKQKFCEQCASVNSVQTAVYCKADYNNKYYHSGGALKCLSDGQGDYALITVNGTLKRLLDSSYFRILSKNGSLLNTTYLEQIEEDAALAVVTTGEVLMKRDDPLKNDAIQYLIQIEKEFGINIAKPFKVFERFNRVPNLLFPDSTPGITITGINNKYIDNLRSLLNKIDDKSESIDSGASVAVCLINFIFTSLIIGYLL